MSPKSRLYTLVKAWKNKPFQEVRDACSESWLSLSPEEIAEQQSWSKRQEISHEPIFNLKGTKLTGCLYRPLLEAKDSQLLRLFMEGLDTIAFWHRSGRSISGVLPIPLHILSSKKYVDALIDLILNSRLPVGSVSLGIQQLSKTGLTPDSEDGLSRIRRLGVGLHLLDFSRTLQEINLLEKFKLEGIHIALPQFRNQDLPFGLLSQIKRTGTEIYATNLALVNDLENAKRLQVDYCYGGLMMSPVSRHQMFHINDSRIAKAIFSLHSHNNLNQNGDK